MWHGKRNGRARGHITLFMWPVKTRLAAAEGATILLVLQGG